MNSYAVIDRFENNFAVCEVEMVSIAKSWDIDIREKETKMMDVELGILRLICGDVQEGDVIVVKHDNTNIITIYGKDENEKKRRIQLIQKITEK